MKAQALAKRKSPGVRGSSFQEFQRMKRAQLGAGLISAQALSGDSSCKIIGAPPG